MIYIRMYVCVLIASLSLGPLVQADIIGGVDFPDGAASFADSVIQYDPLYTGGPVPTDSNFLDATTAIGVPDYSSSSDTGAVTLGRGGLIELAFTDNLLTNSGDSTNDIHVFEIGPDVEDTFVAIRPTSGTLSLLNPAIDVNSDGFYEIGKVFGAISSIDIDAIFPGFAAGQLKFDAVQLVDDRNEGNATGATVGADIDAVGAISSTTSIPEPTSFLMLSLAGLMFIRRGA